MKKYEQLANTIKRRIEEGQYASKLPTEKELTEEFGVSRVTVRKSIELLRRSMPLVRSKKAGTRLIPTQPEKNKQQLVLLMPNSSYESIEIITGVEDYFSKSDIFLTVKFTDFSANSERAILEELLELSIAGFLIYPSATSTNRDIFLGIMERGIPLVFIDRSPSRITCPSVSINNHQTAMTAVNYLYNCGHRQIAFMSSSLKNQQSTTERLWGYLQAMDRHHLPVSRELLFSFQDESEQKQCLDRFFSGSRATAVFCSDDVVAGIFIREAVKRGYRVPDDYSVIGIDDKIRGGGGMVPLTTVRQPYRELGRRAAQIVDGLIKHRINEVTKLYLPAEIVIRDSVRSIK